MRFDDEQISNLVIHQLRNFWIDINENAIRNVVPMVIGQMRESYIEQVNNSFLTTGINPYNSVQWCVFLYRLSRYLFINPPDGNTILADAVFYLNKIMNAVNWNYKAELPIHFSCEHPIGSVLGRAKYSDYLFIYQGVTIGGNRNKGVLKFPTIGENVIIYTDSKIIGDSHIGNNVVIGANTYIFNCDVPDNCIVSGKSPNLFIRNKEETEIKKYTDHIWKW